MVIGSPREQILGLHNEAISTGHVRRLGRKCHQHRLVQVKQVKSFRADAFGLLWPDGGVQRLDVRVLPGLVFVREALLIVLELQIRSLLVLH